MVPVRESSLTFQKRFTLVGEKVGLVILENDFMEELVPIRTCHVPHSFVHDAERIVGDEEQLFSMATRWLRTTNISICLRMYFSMFCSIHRYRRPFTGTSRLASIISL